MRCGLRFSFKVSEHVPICGDGCNIGSPVIALIIVINGAVKGKVHSIDVDRYSDVYVIVT